MFNRPYYRIRSTITKLYKKANSMQLDMDKATIVNAEMNKNKLQTYVSVIYHLNCNACKYKNYVPLFKNINEYYTLIYRKDEYL